MKKFFRCLYYYLLNNWVNEIPSWTVRRFVYKCCGMKIGTGSRIMLHVVVLRPKDIVIGSHSIVNAYSLLDGRGQLEIGDNVNISMYSIIYSASHYSFSKTFDYYTKKTIIDDCCWIGCRAIIMAGSHIRRNGIVAANSVFKGVGEIGGIYVGMPAKLVRYRNFIDDYDSDCEHLYWFE